MRLVYLFRGGRVARLAEGGPREFTYGYAELAAKGAEVAMFEESSFGIGKEWPRPVEALANRVSALLGTHPRNLWGLFRGRRKLDAFDVAVATSHALGLAVAILHRLGLVATRPVLLTMGLIEPGVSDFRLAWLRWVLRDTVLATLSKGEDAHLRAIFTGSKLDIRSFVFGVDLDFWKPDQAVEPGDEILSVGNDPKRDFATLVAAWRPEFPQLTIITSLPVASDKPNIRVERGDWRRAAISDAELRERLRRARLIVVPLKDTLQPSGQSATLQAMACARPVVLSANRGLWDRPQIERHKAATLVAPGDPRALGDAVAALLADRPLAAAMGLRARAMLVAENVSSEAMGAQIQVLADSLRA